MVSRNPSFPTYYLVYVLPPGPRNERSIHSPCPFEPWSRLRFLVPTCSLETGLRPSKPNSQRPPYVHQMTVTFGHYQLGLDIRIFPPIMPIQLRWKQRERGLMPIHLIYGCHVSLESWRQCRPPWASPLNSDSVLSVRWKLHSSGCCLPNTIKMLSSISHMHSACCVSSDLLHVLDFFFKLQRCIKYIENTGNRASFCAECKRDEKIRQI